MTKRWLVLYGSLLLLAVASCGPADTPTSSDDSADQTGSGLTTLAGELAIAIVTYDDGRAGKEYLLRHTDDASLPLDLGHVALPDLASGDRVIVRGEIVDGVLVAEGIWLEPRDDDSLGDTQAEARLINPVRTTAKVAVILVNWGSADSITRDSMRGKVFTNSNSTKAFYWENSYGQFDMVGDVFGWYSISNPGCDTSAISSRARTAARNAGVDIDSYHQVMYYFPKTSACGWSGYAFLGLPTKPARDSFYNGSSNCVVLAQELMHNFGAMHSRSYDCGSAPISSSGCTYSEYGDPFDPMGGGCYHVNAYQKAAMGWYGACNDVTTSANGTFDIVPTQIASDGIQSLRVPMNSNLCPSGFSSCYYTVEYRQPVGVIEGGYSGSASVYNGVLIHVTAPVVFSGQSQTRQTYSYLLDMTPSTSTFTDAALAKGKSWSDPNGVLFTVISTSPSGAKVRVELPGGGTGSPRCIDGTTPGGTPPPSDVVAPTVTMVSPEENATRPPNSSVDVVATVTDAVGVARAELVWTNGGNSWTVACETASSPFSCARSGDTYTWSVTLGGEGSRTWTIKGYDTSGNVTTSATRTLNVATAPPPPPPPSDTVAPTVTALTPEDGATRAPNSSFQVGAVVTDDKALQKAELLWTNGGNSWTVDCANASSPFSCTQSGSTFSWTVGVSGAGSRTWAVRGTDAAGNVTTSPTRTIVVANAPSDTIAPSIELVSPANGATYAADSSASVVTRVTDAGGVAKVELLWASGSQSWTTDCASPASPFTCSASGDTYTFGVALGAAGDRTWSIRATDAAGNVTTSPSRTVTVGSVTPDAAPIVVQVSPANGGTAKASSTISVTATATDDVSVSKVELLWWKGTTSWTVDCNVPQQYFSCTRSGDTYTYAVQVGTGSRTWRIRATDSAGKQTTSDLWTINLQ